MASTFVATGTYSNLTRLQLEQLRKADFFAGSKALTVGDSALPPEGVVGPGDINAEPFLTGPNVLLDDVYALTPAPQPGPGLGTVDQPGVFISETTKWYGPTYVTDGLTGYAPSINSWEDDSGVNFVLAGVQPGDILLIKPGGSANALAVATVTVVLNPTTLILNHIHTSVGGTLLTIDPSTNTSSYLLMRPNAVQLFAVPASGSTGFEQTFLAVTAGSPLHNVVAPTTDQINAARVKNLVPSQYALNATVDRADAVFDAPAPRLSLDKLGYRIVLYPDNGSGTGPDLTNPIATLNPVIDPGIVATDQRLTIDYKAGVVRFSCAPKIGGQIKVPGGVNATTGRLNLYAVFWAVDTSLTAGSARTLYGLRSTTTGAFTPGKVVYDTTNSAWRIGATTSTNSMFVQAPDPSEDTRKSLYFGYYDSSSTLVFFRYFTFKTGDRWKFTNRDVTIAHDATQALGHPVVANEQPVGEALEYTVADWASPPFGGADFTPNTTLNGSSFGRGARDTDTALVPALLKAAVGDFTTVRLKRGRYQITDGVVYVPPGVVIEGDGPNTIIHVRTATGATNSTVTPGFKFGPNTPWGVYDITWDGANVSPTTFDYTLSNVAQRLEGVAVCWNPVRRVWGVAWADINLDAVWFNEINRDGTTVLPGFGVNVKTTANPLFSDLSTNSNNHTSGHYPRICHQANSDQYAIVWVDQVTLNVVGPQVFLNVIMVNPGTPDAMPGQAGGIPPSVSFITNSAFAPVTTANTFSDHPSIAADQSSTSPFWPLYFGCWAYQFSAGAISNSTAKLFEIQTSGIPTEPNTGGSNFGANCVISSTDVDDDGNGNALFVWSRRFHSVLTGTQGTFNDAQHFTDASIANFNSLGVFTGSKFMYLGNTGAFLFPYDSVYGYSHNSSGSASATFVSSYGVDGTVVVPGGSYLQIKTNHTGQYYSLGVPYLIHRGSFTSGGGTTTITDSAVDFTTLGLNVGDVFHQDPSAANGFESKIVTIAPGGNVHQIVLATASVSLMNHNYSLLYGQLFNWALVPWSVIEAAQFTAANQFINAGLVLAGNTFPGGDSNYSLEPTEPDFVRVRRGGDNWIVVYQTFESSCFGSHDSETNWNDNQTSWNGALFVDGRMFLRDTQAYYRKHISTCAIVLSSNITPLNTNIGAHATLTFPQIPSSFDSKASRDIEVSGRSLGAISDPLTYRPNYNAGQTVNPWWRYAWNLSLEVSPACYTGRVPGVKVAGLIPDVTWTGEDWVVVSPTKKVIHSFVGNYIVDSGGTIGFLADPTFMFGTGTPTTQDQNPIRQTVAPGDFIWFPFLSKYATIANINTEHTVELAEPNSTLFNFPASSNHPNIEWVLVRQVSGGPHVVPGGIKNLGYRVAADGRPIITSAYNSFADELPDNSVFLGNGPDHTPLMSRSNTDALFQWGNLGSGSVPSGTGVPDGHNLPGNLNDDILDPEARYMGDTGFRGVAPGQPHGCNDQVLGENPFCAIAWGENFYGFMEHIIEGTTNGFSTATNQVRFYRQSFGPYNSGMRNLKLHGNYNPSLNVPLGNTGAELKVLSQHKVYTRHGGPAGGQGFFATDGFRNFFAIASNNGYLVANEFNGSPGRSPFDGGGRACIQGFYTDAIGRYPIQVQGPFTQNTLVPGTSSFVNPNQFRSDFGGQFNTYNDVEPWIHPAAPRVFWDGQRFIAVWVEGGFQFWNSYSLLCLATFPGSEDAALQGAELVNPQDIFMCPRPTAVTMADSRAGINNATVASNFTVLDVAFSGKSFAVLWAAGLDTLAPAGGAGFPGGQGGVIGVTMIDTASIGGTLIDYDPAPYLTSSGGTTSSTGMTDAVAFTVAASQIINAFDIMLIQGTTSATFANAGKYIVLSNGGSGTIPLYPVPPQTGQTGTIYSMHHSLQAGGGASYVIGQVGFPSGLGRNAFTGPSILWDGKQFLAMWHGKMQGNFLPNQVQDQVETIQCVMFPESGPGGRAPAIKRMAAQVASGEIGYGPTGFTSGIGVVEPNSATPNKVFMVDPSPFASGTGTIVASNLLNDPGVDFIAEAVCQGDWVLIGSGTGALSHGTILAVNNHFLTISADYGGFSATGGGANYDIYRRLNYKVQKGDIANIAVANYAGTNHTDMLGDWLIYEVDNRNNCMILQSGMHTTVGVTTPDLYGTVRTGAGMSDLHESVNFGLNNLENNQNNTTDIAMNPRPLGSSLVIAGASIIGAYPHHVYKVVYNEVNDEYAVLYGGVAGALAIGVFDRQMFEIRRETILYLPGNPCKCADLAWNGSRYMVVFAFNGTPPQGNNPIPLQYRVLTPQLSIEDFGVTDSVAGNHGISSINNLLGNGSGEIPGPTYAFPNIAAVNIAPNWKNCQVRWNNKLNRWIVSGSVCWFPYVANHSTKHDFYTTTPPAVSPDVASTSQEDATEWPLTNTSVTSISSNVLTLNSPTPDSGFLVPGLKLAWIDPTLTTHAWAGMTTILNTFHVGGNVWNVTVATSSFSSLSGSSAKLSVLPREDCFCWTLGYDTPTIQFEDADQCFLENVTFAGGGSDIEERYTRMARPMWQSGGPAVGSAPNGGAINATVQRPSQYNHRLLTPTLKVETLRTTNVKSYSKYRWGAPSFVPGNPVFDRYSTPRLGRG